MSKIRKVAVFLMFVFCSLMTFSSENLQLEKVVILSRHGLRSPLTSPGSRLSKVTPYEWENWDVPASHLTKKGAILETYFGQYINDWLIQNEVIKKGECLSPDNAQIYTNSLQRTIATGQSLTTGIFPGCDIKTEHKMEIGKMDPVFNPVITTDNAKFKEDSKEREELGNKPIYWSDFNRSSKMYRFSKAFNKFFENKIKYGKIESNSAEKVILFEKSSYVAWAGCPTPYFIADELKKSDVLHGTPEDFINRGIEVKIHHEVTEINFQDKTVTVKGNEINGIIFYDKLVIAVGARSFVPNIAGYSKDLENVFTLSHAEHAFKIKDYLNENKSKLKNAVVVGAGFIGLEMAESFRKNGLNVTLIEKADQIFPNVSENLKNLISLFNQCNID